MNHRRCIPALVAVAALGLTACGADPATGARVGSISTAQGWDAVVSAAEGQTVNWYMWGGDPTLNDFVNGYLADRLEPFDITINQVKVSDTAQAIDTMLGERQAGRSTDGSVDLVWVNGENFATGKQADLWACDWAQHLPNAALFDFGDPAVAMDFGVPVDGCEAVWQQANSALVYDSEALDESDVASVTSLIDWAEAHPGRFTYPAPPDFTGSMAVRTLLYDTIGGPDDLTGEFDESAYRDAVPALWDRLNDLEPALWRGGETYPQSQDQVEKMYADGEIDAYFTYGPGAVGDKVAVGVFPDSTREAVLAGGNIANNSFVGIPGNAAHPEAAMVLANLLQDPQTQLALYKAEGTYPGIDLARTDRATRDEFADVPRSPSVLPLERLLADAQPELAGAYVTRIEHDWKSEVLQR
ncbi:ABC transporter substrate-binding protein [Nocardioides sp.]|uniref:ABC transporter substrate-binding protein n=1 Tax=Nocardioides sp. TaxID=35761 RepID=UPI002634E5D6|nr:ABC transporter substrate-binding protein [Nocardioides sp.]MDI6909531.1 ABC transporter substrate-binding protein [Nocardioides sp.]